MLPQVATAVSVAGGEGGGHPQTLLAVLAVASSNWRPPADATDGVGDGAEGCEP